MPATLHFYLRNDRPNSKGECPVYLRITHHRKKKYLNTGIKVKPKHWHEEDERVRRSHKTYKKLNQDLELIEEDAKQARRELARQKKESANAIKSRIDGASRDNFFTLAEEYKNQLKRNKQFWTHKQTKVALEKLKDFNKSESLLFVEIDEEYLAKFQSYMANELGNKGSTIRKNMGAIRHIIRQAIKEHQMTNDPFKHLELPENHDPGYKPKLTYEQIKKMETLDLREGSNMWHARNAFILSFYFCGMRFGDVASLRWENVANGRLKYRMNKTGRPIDVKIKQEAKQFLAWYDHPDKKPAEFILPFLKKLNKEEANDSDIIRSHISSWNALVNDELKTIAEKAEISETISMHVARHSFASYGVSNKGLSVYQMMILLGHKSVKTTQNYLKRIDVQAADEAIDVMF